MITTAPSTTAPPACQTSFLAFAASRRIVGKPIGELSCSAANDAVNTGRTQMSPDCASQYVCLSKCAVYQCFLLSFVEQLDCHRSPVCTICCIKPQIPLHVHTLTVTYVGDVKDVRVLLLRLNWPERSVEDYSMKETCNDHNSGREELSSTDTSVAAWSMQISQRKTSRAWCCSTSCITKKGDRNQYDQSR